MTGEILEILDAAILPHDPMDHLRRDREQRTDLVVARVAVERLVAALRLRDDAGRRGEDVIVIAFERVHHVLDRALAFLDHHSEGAVAGHRQRLGELLRQRIIRAVGLAGMDGDGRFFRIGGDSVPDQAATP